MLKNIITLNEHNELTIMGCCDLILDLIFKEIGLALKKTCEIDTLPSELDNGSNYLIIKLSFNNPNHITISKIYDFLEKYKGIFDIENTEDFLHFVIKASFSHQFLDKIDKYLAKSKKLSDAYISLAVDENDISFIPKTPEFLNSELLSPILVGKDFGIL